MARSHYAQRADTAPGNDVPARRTRTTSPAHLIPRQPQRGGGDRELADLMRRGGRKHHRASWPTFWENEGRNNKARAALESRPETPSVLSGVLCDGLEASQ